MPTEPQEVPVPEDWDRIDALIFSEHLIQALRAIRDQCGPIPLPDAIDVLNERFVHLRDTRPDEFTVSLDGYGDGFYS
ncbi:hypothetical protein [Nocardiopsis aegyptia]